MRLPNLSGKEVIKALSKEGFIAVRQKGSHVILINENLEKKKVVVVPMHREIDKGTLLEIIRQSGLSKDKFLDLL